MRRRLFPLISAASLSLCAVVIVFWVRSHWRITNVSLVTTPPRGWVVGLCTGVIYFSEWNHFPEEQSGWHADDVEMPSTLPPDRYRFIFFGIRSGGGPGVRYVGVSFAYPAGVLGLIPAARAFRRRPRYSRLVRLSESS